MPRHEIERADDQRNDGSQCAMKLQEALQLVNAVKDEDPALRVHLACGCTPLHLRTLLTAHLIRQRGGASVECTVGLYGDLLGALRDPACGKADAVAIVIEWSDLDPRLGYRRVGGWTADSVRDALSSAQRRLAALFSAITELAAMTRVAVSLPTLPLPPAFHEPRWQAGPLELQLNNAVADFAAECAAIDNVAVASPRRLDQRSAAEMRHDLRSHLLADFPYRLEHASALAESLARLMSPTAPLKGIITDLDDTLWRGLVGEVGAEGVSWDLDHRSHGHALYQQTLAALADAGVLVGVASKNEPAEVHAAFARPDMLLSAEHIYPLEIGWGVKSAAVERILRVWNIGTDSVVFVDDSPMEIAEVQRRFAEIRCVRFPTGDDEATLELVGELRDWFGKDTVTEEDRLRLRSIRQADSHRAVAAGDGGSLDDFLAQLGPELVLDFRKDPANRRAFELINKTNQFNINGRRMDEASWRCALASPATVLMVAAYSDKYGPLGQISVMLAQHAGPDLVVDTWVLSCRAFSRRVEHRVLDVLFERFAVERIRLSYCQTERNGPFRNFVAMLAEVVEQPEVVIDRDRFRSSCPPLTHSVTVVGLT
jgi:FkbH-like protein